MKLTFRYYLGAGLLAAAAFAGCSAIERGINQFERGFDDEPPMSGFRPGVYAEPLIEAESSAKPTPFEETAQAPDRLNSQGREPRPTDSLIEPQENGPALFPPPAPAPMPSDGQPAAFRGNVGQIRPICFSSSSCCPSVVSCDPCCAPIVTCDPCSTSSCSSSCCSSGCGESLLSKMHRGISNAHGRMHCFKARVRSKLSRLNPFSCSSCCDPCATCCDPCASCCIPSGDPCCDPCGNGVFMEGVVVGSYPADGPTQYSQPGYHPQPGYSQGLYAPQMQGAYGPQASCNCQHSRTWHPQQQYTQAPAWQQYAAPQQPYYQGQPTYAAPQYPMQQYPQQQQYPQPGAGHSMPTYSPQPSPVHPSVIQPNAVSPGAIQPNAVQPPAPAAVHPVPATSQTPGTAMLGPGYAPRTVPVTRHLQTTYVTVR